MCRWRTSRQVHVEALKFYFQPPTTCWSRSLRRAIRAKCGAMTSIHRMLDGMSYCNSDCYIWILFAAFYAFYYFLVLCCFCATILFVSLLLFWFTDLKLTFSVTIVFVPPLFIVCDTVRSALLALLDLYQYTFFILGSIWPRDLLEIHL